MDTSSGTGGTDPANGLLVVAVGHDGTALPTGAELPELAPPPTAPPTTPLPPPFTVPLPPPFPFPLPFPFTPPPALPLALTGPPLGLGAVLGLALAVAGDVDSPVTGSPACPLPGALVATQAAIPAAVASDMVASEIRTLILRRSPAMIREGLKPGGAAWCAYSSMALTSSCSRGDNGSLMSLLRAAIE
jgi:hypothetical protein